MLTDCPECSAVFTYPDTAKLALVDQCKVSLQADVCRFLSLRIGTCFYYYFTRV